MTDGKLPVECFCGEDSIVVLVEQDVNTKQFMVRGLREAIKAKLDHIGEPTKIKIHKRGTKEAAEDPLTTSIVAAGEGYSCDYEIIVKSMTDSKLLVECFCGEDRLEVLVAKDVITEQFTVDGLRKAIAPRGWDPDDWHNIKIHKRGTKEAATDPLTMSIVSGGESYGSCDYEVVTRGGRLGCPVEHLHFCIHYKSEIESGDLSLIFTNYDNWDDMFCTIQQKAIQGGVDIINLHPEGVGDDIYADTSVTTIAERCVDVTETASGVTQHNLTVVGETRIETTAFVQAIVDGAVTNKAVGDDVLTMLIDMVIMGSRCTQCTILEQIKPDISLDGCMRVRAQILRCYKDSKPLQILVCRLGRHNFCSEAKNGIIMTWSLELQFNCLMWCFVPAEPCQKCGSTSVQPGRVPYKIKVFGFQPLRWNKETKRMERNPVESACGPEGAKSLPIELMNPVGEVVRKCDDLTWGALEENVVWLPDTIMTAAIVLHAAAAHSLAGCDFHAEAYPQPHAEKAPAKENPNLLQQKVKAFLESVEGVDDQ